MIIDSTIVHINFIKANNLHYFYSEDIAHFLIFIEITTFCSNLFTNFLIILVGSAIDIKLYKPKIKKEQMRMLEIQNVQRDIYENNTDYTFVAN